MIDSPKFASDYYQKIADRIADTGLGVRKRVIKLLKAYYNVTEERSARVDICTRIVLRMLDEDDTVKDLAIKTIEELWFLAPSSAPKTSGALHDKSEFLTKVAIIMGVAAQFKDRQSPLEDLLHRIMADKEENDRNALHQRYVEVCETLIDGLVDASDLPGFVSCVSLIIEIGTDTLAERLKLCTDHLPVHLCVPCRPLRVQCCDLAPVSKECNNSK